MTHDKHLIGRRSILGGAAAGAALVSSAQIAAAAASAPPAGATGGGAVLPEAGLPELAPRISPPDRRIGFAFVGLGKLTLEELLPAVGQSKHVKIAGLVSGNAEKARTVARQYGVPENAIYSYQTYDELRNNPDVQVIYIVLPNAMHAEYTIRGAKAGKHILCEKPMANSSTECAQMIDACKSAGVSLMIAYRLQYEPYNRAMIGLVRSKKIGDARLITADNCFVLKDPSAWRLNKAMAGGGPLPDIGIYCLNACRYVTGEEPVEITATTYSTPGDERFKEVEEAVSFRLTFPSGVIANCSTSYNAYRTQRLQVSGTEAAAELDPAFAYRGLRMRIDRSEGGVSIGEFRSFTEKSQFALEMDHMALCVRHNRRPHTPGEEGLQDVRLIEAIYKAAQSGQRVRLPQIEGRDVFRGPPPQDL